jgi:uncharacterized membrane protein YccC
VNAILPSIPPGLRTARDTGAGERWLADPATLCRASEEGERTLLSQPADTPARRLLADETAEVLNGIAYVLDEVALLVDVPGRTRAGYRHTGYCYVAPVVADWLPAVVNGARAFVTISVVELLWVVTAWPNGGLAIVFVTIVLLLMSPKGDLAYLGALAYAVTAAIGIVAAAIVEFAVLPNVETFPAFCAVIGLYFIPVGFAAARTQRPALTAVFGGLAVFAGSAIGALAFRLLPQLSPALLARRLLALTLRDLRRLAISALAPRPADWEHRMFDRLAALPDQATPLQRAWMLTALSVGGDII